MPNVTTFIDHDIRGNLFRDLRAMQKIPVTFPLLMSTCAGIELAGALLCGDGEKFNCYQGRTYFSNFWTQYLYIRSSKGF